MAMKPVERQLALVAYLEQHRFGRTLAEIEADLPDYGRGEAARKKLQRDRRLLAEIGLPIRVQPREGESEDGNLSYCYILDRREVFARPLRLNGAQRRALFRLGEHLRADEDFPHRAWAAAAWEKLAAAEAAGGSLAGDTPLPDRRSEADERLPLLLEAVAGRRKLRIAYPGLAGEEHRVIHPLGLLLRRGFWFLAAWCETRGGLRQFRVRRIGGLDVLDAGFEPPPDFDLGTLATRRSWEAGLGDAGRPATLSVDPALEPLLRRALDGFADWRQTADGLEARVRVADEDAFLSWLLNWGPRLRLKAPGSLLRVLCGRLERALATLEERP
jgi:predicted DNA-binding transcriptional regulator YafY